MQCLVSLVGLFVSVTALAADPPQYEHGDIRIPCPTADEPKRDSVSTALAAKYLEDGTTAWNRNQGCVTCHTNGAYMLVRPALSATLGPPGAETRDFFCRVLKDYQAADRKSLDKSTAPVQTIHIAAGLAEWDVHVAKRLSPETEAALRLMFEIQHADGSWASPGDCWPPYESDRYHGAALAAMAVGTAPGWLENVTSSNDAKLLAGLDRLRNFLRTSAPHDYGKTLLLQASRRWPGLIEKRDQQVLTDMVARHQRPDGGWSIRTMAAPGAWGVGNREARLKAEPDFASPASDGHMTGLAIIVLREAGMPADDARIQRGLSWLKSNQRASGRWWTESLNGDRRHYITYSGTAFPLLAMQLCQALPPAADRVGSDTKPSPEENRSK